VRGYQFFESVSDLVDDSNCECTDSQLNAEHWFARIKKLYHRNCCLIIIINYLTYRCRLCIKIPPTHLTNKTEINRNRTFKHAKHTISTNTCYESYSLPLLCQGPFQNLCVAQRCADMGQLGFANTDIRYPDLSANFTAAENPDILK